MTDFVLSLIRTVVPLAVGSLVGGLTVRGIRVEPEAVGSLTAGITALVGSLYYAGARWLESRWPALGYLLGSAQSPQYPDSVETRAQVEDFYEIEDAQMGHARWDDEPGSDDLRGERG